MSASTRVISGWSIRSCAEGLAVAGVVDRLGQRQRASARPTRPRAVEPRQRHHVDDGRERRARLADQPAGGARRIRPRPVALERLPSLSLSRISWTPFRVPSGRKRGTRKQDSPSTVCASTRKASLIGADTNHLWPVRRQMPSPAVARRAVVLASTSLPPCFSVDRPCRW